MRPRPICGRRHRADPGGAALTIRDRGERMAVATQTAPSQRESFAALLNESMGVANSLEGTVVKGRVISIENDAALIDVGLKSEGRVPLKEFAAGGQEPEIHVGDIVEVFLERMEDKNGEASLSREKARREEAWTQLEKSFQALAERAADLAQLDSDDRWEHVTHCSPCYKEYLDARYRLRQTQTSKNERKK